jgi:hypothetical protein
MGCLLTRHYGVMAYNKTHEMDGLHIGESEHMPTAYRRQWMRDYMKEYRRGKLRGEVIKGHLHPGNPGRREKLKEIHRLDSFKWRLSQLLSYQHEILFCIEYGPEYGIFKDEEGVVISGYDEDLCNDVEEVLQMFPTLEDFYIFDIGGSEIFKVFVLEKYSKKFDRVTNCLVGVLDKLALLENLQELPSQGGSKWEKVLNKVKAESIQGTWQKLDFSREPLLQLDRHTWCYLLKCTARDHPQWNSRKLHSCLCGWAMGSRSIGSWGKEELPPRGNPDDNFPRKVIISPILRDESA